MSFKTVGGPRIPGQAPLLLRGYRRLMQGLKDFAGGVHTQGARGAPQSEYLPQTASAMSSLTGPAKPLRGPVIPGQRRNVRTAEEVVDGLGLDSASQNALIGKLREWSQADNAVVFRRSLVTGLRALAPRNLPLRQELGRRALLYYSEVAPAPRRADPSLVVQKAEAPSKPLSGGNSPEAQHRSAQVGEVRDWQGGKFRKVAPGKWVPVSSGGAPGAKPQPKPSASGPQDADSPQAGSSDYHVAQQQHHLREALSAAAEYQAGADAAEAADKGDSEASEASADKKLSASKKRKAKPLAKAVKTAAGRLGLFGAAPSSGSLAKAGPHKYIRKYQKGHRTVYVYADDDKPDGRHRYHKDDATQAMIDAGDALYDLQRGSERQKDDTGFNSHDMRQWRIVRGDPVGMKRLLAKYKRQIGEEHHELMGLADKDVAAIIPKVHPRFGSIQLTMQGRVSKKAFDAVLGASRYLKEKGLASWDRAERVWFIPKHKVGQVTEEVWAEYAKRMAVAGVQVGPLPASVSPKQAQRVDNQSAAPLAPTADDVIDRLAARRGIPDMFAVKREPDGMFRIYTPFSRVVNAIMSNRSGVKVEDTNGVGFLSGITEFRKDGGLAYRQMMDLSVLEEAIDKISRATGWKVVEHPNIAQARVERDKTQAELKKPIPEVAAKIDPKYELFPYQNEAVRFLAAKDGKVLVGDEMGLGKTIQALAYGASQGKRMLVVVPKTVRRTWIQEAERFFPDYFKGASRELVAADLRKHGQPDLSGVNIATVNYESLEKFMPAIKAAGFDTIVVDESHRIKNPKAKITKTLMGVRDLFEHRILMSGTAVKNKRNELATQLEFVSPGSSAEILTGYTGAVWNKLKQSVYIARQKREVLTELPDKLTSITQHAVPGMPAFPSDIGEMSAARVTAAKAKAPVTADFVKEALATSDSALLVFSESKAAAEEIAKKLGKVAILHHGQMSDDKREAAKAEFQRPGTPKRVFVSTRQSLTEGATLTAADKVVFNDLPWTAADLRQAEARAHRIGQKNTVNVYWMTAQDSEWDAAASEILLRKYELNRKLNEGKKLTVEEQEWMSKPVSLSDIRAEMAGKGAGPAPEEPSPSATVPTVGDAAAARKVVSPEEFTRDYTAREHAQNIEVLDKPVNSAAVAGEIGDRQGMAQIGDRKLYVPRSPHRPGAKREKAKPAAKRKTSPQTGKHGQLSMFGRQLSMFDTEKALVIPEAADWDAPLAMARAQLQMQRVEPGMSLIWCAPQADELGAPLEVRKPPGWPSVDDLVKGVIAGEIEGLVSGAVVLDELSKAKYIKREGTPGNYVYTYRRPDGSLQKVSQKPRTAKRGKRGSYKQTRDKEGNVVITGGDKPPGTGWEGPDRSGFYRRRAQQRGAYGKWEFWHPTETSRQVGMFGATKDPSVEQLEGKPKPKAKPAKKPQPPAVVEGQMGLFKALDEAFDVLEKGAGHKYLKRIPTGKPKPKYRYIYKHPKRKGLTSSEDVIAGSKFKVEHGGQHGHFEVLSHDKDRGMITVRHDESGREVHITEADLHRMLASHHGRKTERTVAERQAKYEAKRERKKGKPLELKVQPSQPQLPGTERSKQQAKSKAKTLPRATMEDLGGGGYDDIIGFNLDPRVLEEQAAATKGELEFAIIPQSKGYVLAVRQKGTGLSGGEAKGSSTQIMLRGKGRGIEEMKADWVVVEADSLIASHNPRTFDERSDYPVGVQERPYHRDRSEQGKVDAIANSLRPGMVANNNPDAINGAPIVTQDGVVLGGNGRTMGLQRAYQIYPESAQKMRDHLQRHARAFGVAPQAVAGMRNPVLVRRVKAEGAKEMTRLGRRMNEALTQGLDQRAAEVAVSKFVTQDVVDDLAHRMEPGQTLNAFLTSTKSKDFVQTLTHAGIIDDRNANQFINAKTGLLNGDGRERVTRVLAARLIPDSDLLDSMNQTWREALARSVPSLTQAEHAGWDMKPHLLAAVQTDLDMQTKGFRRTATGRSEYLRQTGLFGDKQMAPEAAALLQVLHDHGEKMQKLPSLFKQFALEAVRQHHDNPEGAGATIGFALLAAPKVTPAQALAQAFGLKGEEMTRALPVAAALRAFQGEPLRKADDVADEDLRPYLVHAVMWEMQNLLRGELRDVALGAQAIDGKRMITRLRRFIVETAKADPVFARALGANPLSDGQLQGIVQAAARAKVTDIAKALAVCDLRKAS